jgi:hypothetical protein
MFKTEKIGSHEYVKVESGVISSFSGYVKLNDSNAMNSLKDLCLKEVTYRVNALKLLDFLTTIS